MNNLSNKPRNPYPIIARRLLRKSLPNNVYRRYIGRHEDESLRLWKLISAQIHFGDAILDIGAFKGDYALAAREVNREAIIFAFEPNPYSFNIIQEKCHDQDIEVINLAIAETDGSVSFMLNSSTSRMVYRNFKSPVDIIQVPGISLDTWITENGVSPSLIKIDTEGTEAEILRGGEMVLDAYRPIILCEVLSDQAGKDVMDALPKDYYFYHIDENSGFEERDKITRKKWRNHNWLFVPMHKKSALCN